MCSGKDSWAERVFVELLGFGWQSTSNIAREYIAEHNMGEPTRDLVREVTAALRSQHGTDYLARTALERLNPDDPRIVGGLYVVGEVEHVRAVGGKIIHIATDDDLAFTRMSSRR